MAMKNKISKTEKFLWDLYEISEKIDNILSWSPRSWREAINPLYHELKRSYKRKMDRKNFQNLIYYLKKKGIIKDFKKEEVKGWMLTEKGRERILKIKIKDKANNRRKRKDDRWIMVIFDIPEKERIKRDFLRRSLYELGFQMLQKSVWVSPFDVLDKVKEIIKFYSLEPFVKLLLIEEIQIKS